LDVEQKNENLRICTFAAARDFGSRLRLFPPEYQAGVICPSPGMRMRSGIQYEFPYAHRLGITGFVARFNLDSCVEKLECDSPMVIFGRVDYHGIVPLAHFYAIQLLALIKPKAEKDLKAMSVQDRRRVVERLRLLEVDLSGDVKRLTNHQPEYRMRAGDWRALFEKEEIILGGETQLRIVDQQFLAIKKFQTFWCEKFAKI
jgi:mRNA interferase RelE/StbE